MRACMCARVCVYACVRSEVRACACVHACVRALYVLRLNISLETDAVGIIYSSLHGDRMTGYRLFIWIVCINDVML